MRKKLGIWSVTILVVTVLSCEAYERIADEGLINSKNQSVFQTFSGKYCRVTNEDGSQSTKVDCGNLANFVNAQSAHCQQNDFTPRYGFFPGHKQRINLCNDRSNESRQDADVIRILVFADTGAGQSSKSGYSQKEVGEAMLEICPSRSYRKNAERHCDFALVSGDLIYPSGVDDVFDTEFDDKFESIYGGFGDFDFYQVPGNHDYNGNVKAQVEYSWFSSRWHMPEVHYPVNDLPDWLHIYGMDTNGIIDSKFTGGSFGAQKAAIKSEFCDKEGWKILFGHHPSLSHGSHGSEIPVAEKLSELWDECSFNLQIAGHDHDQEHVHSEKFDVIVQGAGGAKIKAVDKFPGESIEDDDNMNLSPYEQRYAKSAHGFAVIELSSENMDVYFFDTTVWKYGPDGYEDPVKFEDHIYHCHWDYGDTDGCKVVSADDEKWK